MAAAAALLCGCVEPEPAPAGPADLVLSTSVLDFGQVQYGVPATETFNLINQGGEGIRIASFVWTAGLGFTFVGGDPEELFVAAGETERLAVRFAPPQDAAIQSVLRLFPEGADSMTIDLVADGLAPSLSIDPAGAQFDERPAGCAAEQVVSLTNVGRTPLTVTDVVLDEAGTEGELSLLDWAGEAQLLAPGDGANVVVRYVPLDPKPDSAELAVFSDDPVRPEVVVEFEGSAYLGPGASSS